MDVDTSNTSPNCLNLCITLSQLFLSEGKPKTVTDVSLVILGKPIGRLLDDFEGDDGLFDLFFLCLELIWNKESMGGISSKELLSGIPSNGGIFGLLGEEYGCPFVYGV